MQAVSKEERRKKKISKESNSADGDQKV